MLERVELPAPSLFGRDVSETRATRVLALVAALALALTAIVASAQLTSVPSAAAAGAPGAGGEFHPIEPVRVLDTRDVVGVRSTAATSETRGTSFNVPVHGIDALPADAGDILAVVANITVAAPSQAGWAAVYPTGASISGTPSSIVNFQAGQTVPNVAIVGLGTDGQLTVELRTPVPGNAHVLIDLFGFISTSGYDTNGARFTPVGPGRILDTRSTSPVAAGTSVPLQIRGADTFDPAVTDIVPNDGSVSAVMLNLTVVNVGSAAQGTYASVTPTAPSGPPATSNVNLGAGQVKASMVIVPVGDDGRVHIYNNRGTTNFVVDVLGYFRTGADPSTLAGRIVPLDSPFRALDTRRNEFGAVKLGHGQAEQWSFKRFVESVQIGGESAGTQSALIGNLTGVGLERTFSSQPVQSYLTAYPGNLAAEDKPTASNLNIGEGVAVPNTSLLKYGAALRDGVTDPYVVWVFNAQGSVHYLLDVQAIVLADSPPS